MFQLAERPFLFPGHTLLGDTRGPVADTGIELASGGRVYLTKREAAEVARLFGFAEPAQVDAMNAQIRQLELQVRELEGRIAQTRRLMLDDLDEVPVG